MPLDERAQHLAMNLMVEFSHKNMEALSVPNYADYLASVGLAPNYEAAIFMALSSAKDFARAHKDCAIIGNCDKQIEFDVIINVNINHEEGEPLVDKQLQKLRELYGTDADLGPIINHTYSEKDGEYAAGGTVEQVVELVLNLCKAKSN